MHKQTRINGDNDNDRKYDLQRKRNMPGANCAIPECGSTRRETYINRAIFQVPNRTGEFYEKWRKDILAVLLKFCESR